jgi:hypothetical protein
MVSVYIDPCRALSRARARGSKSNYKNRCLLILLNCISVFSVFLAQKRLMVSEEDKESLKTSIIEIRFIAWV